jgi:hypothetical protein
MKERILVIGGPESGKTTALIQVAIATPHLKWFAFDTEYSIERASSFFGGIPDNVEIVTGENGMPATTSESMSWGMKQTVYPYLMDNPGGILIDMVENVYDRAKERHAESKGYSLADMQARTASRGRSGDVSINEDWNAGDWSIISKYFYEVLQVAAVQLPSHLVATAAQKPLITNDGGKLGGASYLAHDKKLVAIWEGYGSVPEGPRKLSHNFDTAFGLEATGLAKKTYRLSCAKERARGMKQPKKYTGEKLAPDEVRFEGTEDETPVYNMWNSHAQLVEDNFSW